MADNNDEFPDMDQLYSNCRQTSDALNIPEYTTDSISRTGSSTLGPVPVSQPDTQNSAATVSYVYANMPCREWFEAKDNDFYLDFYSQSSTPSSSQCSHATDTSCKDVFIKESDVTATLLRQSSEDFLSDEARFIERICRSRGHTATTGDGQGLDRSYVEAYAMQRQQRRHQILANPFLFTPMKSRIPSLAPLPRFFTTKTKQTFLRNCAGSLSWMTNNRHQASSSATHLPHSKRVMYPIQHPCTSTHVLDGCSFSSSSLETPTSPGVRPRKKMCRTSANSTGQWDVSPMPSFEFDSSPSDDDDDECPRRNTTHTDGHSSSSSSDEETPEDYNMPKIFYGLFGSESSKMPTGENLFERLPDEIKKIIFCQLNSRHLFEVCPKVCRDWRRIIHSEKFMPWKFRLYCFKKKNIERCVYVTLTSDLGEASCIASIISSRQIQSSIFTDLLPSLKRHVYYNEALLLLKNSFPDCFFNNMPSPWSLVVVLCVISDSVKAVHQLLQILVSASSQSPLDIILDQVYKILYLFTSEKLRYSILYGIMYRLTSALHTLENFCTMTDDPNTSIQPTHQQSMLKYCEDNKKIRFSSEQLQILNYNVQPGDIIKIIGYAGTGKTSTLVRYTKMRPGLNFLLVVFNKYVAEHAKTIFPENVHSTTGHDLAFKHTGKIYAKNDKLHLRNLKVSDLEGVLRCAKDYNSILHCQVVLTVLECFFASKDEKPQYNHIQAAMKIWKFKMHPFHSTEFCWEHLLGDAITFWHKMIDLNEKNIKMTQNGYFKLYQIKNPQLSKYDVILIDEAQDMSIAILDTLVSQNQAKIIAGDQYQENQSCCEVENFTTNIKASHIFYLTQPFRFGHEIANVANFVLNYYMKREPMLFGCSKESTIEGKEIGRVAYISRCNAALFKMAALLCCVQRPKVKIFFIGGLASWEFDLLRRLCIFRDEGYFQSNSSSQDIFLNKFPSYWALSRYVKESKDAELLPKVKILEQYTSNLHKVLSYIERSEVKDINDADVIFSTVEMAKGLEFSTVKVLDDFYLEIEEERNLLYVALTRAKNSLILNQNLVTKWERFGELRLNASSYDSLTEKPVCCCNICPIREEHNEILPPIVIQKKKLRLVDDKETGGFICKKCTTNLQSLSFLYEKYEPFD